MKTNIKISSSCAPLWEAIWRHTRNASYPFHVPGHKGGRGLAEELKGAWSRFDLTELDTLDNLYCPKGPIAEAEALASEFAGAWATHFTTNGSSAALIAAVLASCPRGSQIALPQNAHLSLFHACVLADLLPRFMPIEFDPELGIPLGLTPASLRQFLASESVSLVVLVHPTYHGVCLDLAPLAAICKEFAVPLLVDEAHGTHLLLAQGAPSSALSMGADIVVQSVHKTGLALGGAAWVHCQSEKLSGKVKQALRLVQSTSPSYLLLASLDLARRSMSRGGVGMYKAAVTLAKAARELFPTYLPPHPYQQDPLRLVIQASKLGMDGYTLAKHLTYGKVVPEMVEPSAVTLVIGLCDGDEALVALKNASEMLPMPRLGGFAQSASPPWPICPQRLRPALVYFQPSVEIKLAEAQGQVAAEAISPYPPGIPIIWPGQEFTRECIAYLEWYRASSQGLNALSANDKVKVVGGSNV